MIMSSSSWFQFPVVITNNEFLYESNDMKKGVMTCMLQVTSIVSVFFIVVSILSFCLKTHPTMRVPVIRNLSVLIPVFYANHTASSRSAAALPWLLDKQRTQPHDAFFYIECVCNT